MFSRPSSCVIQPGRDSCLCCGDLRHALLGCTEVCGSDKSCRGYRTSTAFPLLRQSSAKITLGASSASTGLPVCTQISRHLVLTPRARPPRPHNGNFAIIEFFVILTFRFAPQACILLFARMHHASATAVSPTTDINLSLPALHSCHAIPCTPSLVDP